MNNIKIEEHQKLVKENKRLKTTNRVLLIYVILSLIIMVYNNFL